jgi:hypothetical protein
MADFSLKTQRQAGYTPGKPGNPVAPGISDLTLKKCFDRGSMITCRALAGHSYRI